MDDSVDVAGHMTPITVAQTAKNLWTVRGVVAGLPIVVRAANRRTAIARWRKAAENRD